MATKPVVYTGTQDSNLRAKSALADGYKDLDLKVRIKQFQDDVGRGAYTDRAKLERDYQALMTEPGVLNRGNPAAKPEPPKTSESVVEGRPEIDPEVEQGANPCAPKPVVYQPEVAGRPAEAFIGDPKVDPPWNHDIDTPPARAALSEERKQVLLDKQDRASQQGDMQLAAQLGKMVAESESTSLDPEELEGRFRALREAPLHPGRGMGGDIIPERTGEGDIIEPESIRDVPDDPAEEEAAFLQDEILPTSDMPQEVSYQSLVYLDVRGAFYQVSLHDKPTAGFYAIEELNDFLENHRVEAEQVQPILIQSVETTQSDIIGMVNCLENVKVVYTFGQNLGNVGIIGEILLGPLGGGALGTEASGVRQLMNFFEKYRASNWRDAVKVSCLGESFFVYLTGLRLLRVDPDLHIMPFQLTGILLDLNREKINPSSKVVTQRNGLEAALSVYAPTGRTADQTGAGGDSNVQAAPGESQAGEPGNPGAETYEDLVNAGIDAQACDAYMAEQAREERLEKLRSDVGGLQPSASVTASRTSQPEVFEPVSGKEYWNAVTKVAGSGWEATKETGDLFASTVGFAMDDTLDSAASGVEIAALTAGYTAKSIVYDPAADVGAYLGAKSGTGESGPREFASRIDVSNLPPGSNLTPADMVEIRKNWKLEEARKEGLLTAGDLKRLGPIKANEVIELNALQKKAADAADTKGFAEYAALTGNDMDAFRKSPERQAVVDSVLESNWERKRAAALITKLEADQAKEDYSKPGAPERVDTNLYRAQFGLPPRPGTNIRRP